MPDTSNHDRAQAEGRGLSRSSLREDAAAHQVQPGRAGPSERRSPAAARATVTILPSTAPLSPTERDALRHLARRLRLAADRCDEALARDTIEHGVEAVQAVETVTLAGQQVAAILGGRR